MLQENTLWGLDDKEKTAIKRLQAFARKMGMKLKGRRLFDIGCQKSIGLEEVEK
jgi:hypothetical protein